MENGRNEIGGRQLVAGYLGVVLMLIGGIILLPLAALPAFWDEVSMARYFTVPGVAAVFAGYVMYLPIKGREALRLTGHQDALIVVLSWVLAIVFCAVPFMMTGNYDFTQAVFECTSGWSTTGLSVVDVFRRGGAGTCDGVRAVRPARDAALQRRRALGPPSSQSCEVCQDDYSHLYGLYPVRHAFIYVFWDGLV